MNTAELIALLLNLFSKFGPTLVKQVTELIDGNPQLAGETDDQYVARVNILINQTLDEAAAADKKIIEER